MFVVGVVSVPVHFVFVVHHAYHVHLFVDSVVVVVLGYSCRGPIMGVESLYFT